MNIKAKRTLVLASGSPRRQEMFRSLGVRYTVDVPNIDERVRSRETPLKYVQRLSFEKAYAIAHKRSESQKPKELWRVLAADTIVVFKGKVLGKPRNRVEAVKMLKLLSGNKHQVITAFCWIGNLNLNIKVRVAHVTTDVYFSKLSPKFCDWYASTGEPMDKAGAYAAQGIGLSFIEKVRGSYSNVIGLPLPQVLSSYEKHFGGKLIEEFTK